LLLHGLELLKSVFSLWELDVYVTYQKDITCWHHSGTLALCMHSISHAGPLQ